MVPAEICEKLRQEMPVVSSCAYLDHAAVGPLTSAARAAIQRWLDEAAATGDKNWPRWHAEVESTRKTFASLIGSSIEEVALVPSTTYGINVVAAGFPWREGDSVVVPTNEFPSNRLPWLLLKQRGVRVLDVPPAADGSLDTERVLNTADETTRLIAISWVGYATGYRADLGELTDAAHRRGLQVFVDAIQGLGAFPLDVESLQVDYLAADGHKWMLGPEGAGFLYVAQRNLPRLAPLMVGWNSVRAGSDFDNRRSELKATAARYEGGTTNMAGFIGLGSSLRTLADCGSGDSASGFADSILQTAAYACDRLRDLGAAVYRDYPDRYASGIVSFEFPGCDSAAIRAACLDRGVICSNRHGRLRIAIHGYNNREDIDRLAEALREHLSSPR